MALQFSNLSFWEKKWLTDDLDFIIVGAGLVGLSTAFHLKKDNPKAKILIVDKGIIPFSASSKNAGFACFGSPSELLDDLSHMDEFDVWQTVAMRWNGLNALNRWLGAKEIELQTLGSWDLIEKKESSDEIRENIPSLNRQLKEVTGEENVFSEDQNAIQKFDFKQINTCFNNRLEGQLNPSKLIQCAIDSVQELGVAILRGVELKKYDTLLNHVAIETNFGELKSANLVLCTNGFTPEFEQKFNLKPARAQVLITQEIENLKVKGTFHMDRGYYYFRNVGNRLLIGGGRNLDFEKETTTNLMTTEAIQKSLEEKLRDIVLPNTAFIIENRWAGIMGVGNKKEPIIERISPRVTVGIRMGGMGVAIGTLVGQKLSKLHS